MNQDGEPEVARIVAGPFQTNTYLVWSGEDAILIDPGEEAHFLLEKLPLKGRKVVGIVSTHGHLDHVFDVPVLKESLSCLFSMGSGDEDVLKWSYSVSEKYMGKPLLEVKADRFLREGDRILFGDSAAEVIVLPGHTPGSIGLLVGTLFFTGDTLFKGTIGRTDLGGSMDQMNRTLARIRKMNPELKVLPGHGPDSTIGEELETNPFLI